MRSLMLLAAAFVFCGFHLSSAVLTGGAASSDVPNLVAVSAKPNTTTPHPTTTAHVTNTTKHVTTAHVTNTTTAQNTTTVYVTNTTTAQNTTTAYVTNTTTAQNTTTAHATRTVLPTLTPHFSLPNTGQYNVSLKNATCIKATIGIQLFVKQKAKDLYFNIPPDKTSVSGKCGDGASWIIFKFNSGFVNFTFVKDGKQYYVWEMSVALNAMNNLGTSYHGTVNHMKLFRTTLGYSYKCNSKQIVSFSTDSLHILIVNTQLQAFGVPGGKFGREQKCALDSKFIVPILFGISVFILIVAVIVVYLICRHRRFVGYQRI
ncbi:lysosome-associated membrane glycoprotein 3 isoform X2 [Scyliorhinus torazame]|uniref:lysosome-associated membrane glycoprotein 3 isoform X2 n=1 Tax=Scyliorhinus torazame TaxID=75743 RepID=UPI003B5BAEA9